MTKTKKILVLADDLTGASELGGIAHMFGLSVKILFNGENVVEQDEDVVIIDSNSRNMSPEEAYGKIKELASKIDFSAFDIVFKKVDSVLRGCISSELEALTKALGCKVTLLVPANPSKNRVIKNGMYYIDDIALHHTGFRFDPHFPRCSKEVEQLLVDSTNNVFSVFDLEREVENQIVIPDVSTLSELQRIAASLPIMNVLPGGGADFFREILNREINSEEKQVSIKSGVVDGVSFIVGSNSVMSRKSIRILTHKGYSVFHLPMAALRQDGDFKQWLTKITEAAERGDSVVISGPIKRLDDAELINKTGERIVDAAILLVANLSHCEFLMIEGGETASGFIRKQNWDKVLISQVYGPGIVELCNNENSVKVIIKPGSYPWPKALLEDLKSCEVEQE